MVMPKPGRAGGQVEQSPQFALRDLPDPFADSFR
jgi:hypothetical protein